MTSVPARRRRAGRAAAVTLALLTGLLLAPASASAAEPEDLSLSVVEMGANLTPGDDFDLRVRVRNGGAEPAEGLRVVGTLHSAVGSRFAFQLAVDDGRLGTVLDGFSTEVDELHGGTSRAVDLGRPAAELGFRRPDQFGVYPLRLQLLDQGDVVDELRTAVVFSSDEIEEPVSAALLYPVDAPPLLGAGGAYDRAEVLAELAEGGRAQGLLGAVAARERFPVTLVPDALLLDEAAELAAGAAPLEPAPGDDLTDDAGGDARDTGEDAGDAADDRPEDPPAAPEDYLATQARTLLERANEVAGRAGADVLAMPYGRADLTALVRGDMALEAQRHVEEAQATLERLTGAAPLAGALWPPDALNHPTLAAIARGDAAVDTLVLSERHLDVPSGRALTPSPVRRLGSDRSDAPTVLVPDPWLEDVLDVSSAPAGVPVAVQRVLAETAAVYFERPFAADRRGLLLAPPQTWDPPRGMAGALMDALDAAPWLRPVTLSRLARSVDPDTDAVRLHYDSAARARELSDSYVAALREARRSLGSLAGVLAPSDDTPTRFDRLLRAAASVHFRREPAQGRAIISEVAGTVADLYSSVDVVEGPQVWMDEEGPVPVTVVNNADVPLRVRVRLLSQRFVIDDEPIGQPPDEQGGWVLQPSEARTLTFQARAVTPGGRAPISVVVEDVHGVLTLAEGTVVVRSTAVSVAAVVVTAAAGLFLLGWLLRQAARRRRRRPRPAAPVDADAPAAQVGGRSRRSPVHGR